MYKHTKYILWLNNKKCADRHFCFAVIVDACNLFKMIFIILNYFCLNLNKWKNQNIMLFWFYKHTTANTQIQKHIYNYINTSTQNQMHKFLKYTNTNTNTNTNANTNTNKDTNKDTNHYRLTGFIDTSYSFSSLQSLRNFFFHLAPSMLAKWPIIWRL